MGAGFVRISTDASFERDVLRSGRLVLVAFGASWCGPCRLLAPGLRALASTQKDRLMVTKLDPEANPATADLYGVETYPTCILFKAGEEVERLDGYMPLRKIEARLRPYLDAA
ncbi:MAG: thioredoxin 1 [Sphingomonadales bacterium]|jgi:thioredoxin 1|nr:thioredoxin 1 [Sphingomonadales bacterium]MEA3043020.1 thioredoxin 1 [Sphingomonadales bacterium]MEA3046581.1 thioredoxin 1 [Sphingomonadales bacterium]